VGLDVGSKSKVWRVYKRRKKWVCMNINAEVKKDVM